VTTIAPRLTGDDAVVKSELLAASQRIVDWLFHLPDTASQHEIELEVQRGVRTLGAMLFSAVLTRRCRDRALAELADREPGTWRFRLDEDYSAHLTTTFGRITVPTFAWREQTVEGREVTRVPDYPVPPPGVDTRARGNHPSDGQDVDDGRDDEARAGAAAA
jgi:hypothetical protein